MKDCHENATTTCPWLVMIKNYKTVQSKTNSKPRETKTLKKWSGDQDQSPVQQTWPPAMFLCSTWRPTCRFPWHQKNFTEWFIFIDWSSFFQIHPEGRRRRASVPRRAAMAQVMWLGCIHTTAACLVVPTRIASHQRVGPLSGFIGGIKSTAVETTILLGYLAPNLLNLLCGSNVSFWSLEGAGLAAPLVTIPFSSKAEGLFFLPPWWRCFRMII